MFLESSFFPAFQNLFLGVPRAFSDQRERAVRFFIRGYIEFVLSKKCQPVFTAKRTIPKLQVREAKEAEVRLFKRESSKPLRRRASSAFFSGPPVTG
ncbi:hypothetical protein [Desulfonatronum thiodismutans]|uniref:hypothetical protein n=1 Tax=Desulfonatronum thiodismutans TaxID=159290 RepID=UPI0004ABDC8A|nr:hypothetical protein [Desulfonatronum thiodismutans]